MVICSSSLTIQQAFSLPCLVNLISKDIRLIFSIYLTNVHKFPIRAPCLLPTSRSSPIMSTSVPPESGPMLGCNPKIVGVLKYTVKPVSSSHSQKDRKWGIKTNYRLMQVKSIAECTKGSILQYFRPALSYHMALRPLFCVFLSGRLRQVLL